MFEIFHYLTADGMDVFDAWLDGRVYYAMIGWRAVLLLCGGDKRRQSADIRRAIALWKDYNERKQQS